MKNLPRAATGGCLCGAVRYRADGPPLSTIYCHCESCRRHTGAPVVALAGYRRDQVTYTRGQPSLIEFEDDIARAFCANCGTPLTWEGDGGEHGPLVELHIGTMDDPDACAPECHIHHGERLRWFETVDRLPRYRVWHDDGDEPYSHEPASLAEVSDDRPDDGG